MKRHEHRSNALLAFLIMIEILFPCMVVAAAAPFVYYQSVSAALPPCTPQAPNLATRDACHTQTASASGATASPTVTRIASTPTRVTPLPTFIANPVYVRVRVNGADLGIILLEPGKPINFQVERIEVFATPTVTALP